MSDIQTEVLAAMSESLRALNTSLAHMVEGRADERRLLMDIHERVIKIESNRLERAVAKLEGKIEKLELAAAEQRGAVGLAGWVSKNMPWLAAVVIAAAGAFGLAEIKN